MNRITTYVQRLYKLTVWRWMPKKIRNRRNVSGYSPEIAEKVLDANEYVLTHLSMYEDNSTIRYVKKYGLSYVFNDYFINQHYSVPNTYKDENSGLFYVMHNSHKMYFPPIFETKEKVGAYYRNILMEQDTQSPHYYGKNEVIGENTVVIDAGTAEGFFSLDYIEKAKKIIMVECDSNWLHALEQTFCEYIDKVVIIEKFLGYYDDDEHVTIDSILKEYTSSEDDIFIKMDLEGCEYESLKGAESCRDRKGKVNMAITVYHNIDDEEKVRSLLTGYEISVSSGYMFFSPLSHKFEAPYLTHGVLYIAKK